MECLNRGDACSGVVVLRPPLSDTGEKMPRCDRHWERRLKEQERFDRLRSNKPTRLDDRDPAYAGERWDED